MNTDNAAQLLNLFISASQMAGKYIDMQGRIAATYAKAVSEKRDVTDDEVRLFKDADSEEAKRFQALINSKSEQGVK